MKTFIIVKRDDLTIQGYYQAETKDDTSANRSQLHAEPVCVHIELAAGLTVDTVMATSVDDVISLSEDSAKVAAKALLLKQNAAQLAYETMNAEVIAQMALVFGTNKPESATAYKETWDVMAEFPADWEAAGIKAAFAVAGLAVNDVLDTAQKVQDYANAKLVQVKAYGIWRMQRIESFKAERDAILAG